METSILIFAQIWTWAWPFGIFGNIDNYAGRPKMIDMSNCS